MRRRQKLPHVTGKRNQYSALHVLFRIRFASTNPYIQSHSRQNRITTVEDLNSIDRYSNFSISPVADYGAGFLAKRGCCAHCCTVEVEASDAHGEVECRDASGLTVFTVD